jgi:tetratricopeptide (TPR) repeat protein
MNQAFNPVFAFKRLLGKENANNVISRLICHPIIWELFSEENKYLRLADIFGGDVNKWTIENICLNTVGIKEPNSLSINNEDNWNSLDIEDQLIEIYKSVMQIKGQKQAFKTWGEIFEKLQLGEIEDDQIFRKWGTVFEIVVNDRLERKELENALVQNNSSKINLLSFLIHCSTDQAHINDILVRNINILIDHPNILRELIFKLNNLGEHKKAKILVKKYLDHPDILKKEIGCDNSTLLHTDKLEELKYLSELRVLSLFVGDEKKCQFYKDLAEKLFIQLSNITPVKLYTQEMEIDNKDLFSLDNYISIEKQGEKAHSLDDPNLKDISNAFNLMNSNENAAREICKRFISDSNKQGIENVINSPEVGYLIDPIDIAKIFIKLRLEKDAVLLLEETLNSRSGNSQIIKFLAHYSRIFGDHRRAVKYYSILFTKSNMLREEKIQFCKSLQYLGLWQNAFVVQKTINKLNINDKLEFAISALRAEKKAEFKNEIEGILSTSPNNKTAQTLKALFHQRNNEKSSSSTLIASVISEPNKDIRTIKFIVEYLGENGGAEKQQLFINDLPVKYKSHPEIALLNAKVKRSLGKIQENKEILRRLFVITGEITQVVLEGILYELINNNMFEEAENILQTYENKWVLSPKIGQAEAKVSIEAGEYTKAGRIISSLIDREIINEEIIVAYGCLLLKTSLAEFPYRRKTNKIPDQEINRFQELIHSLRVDNPSLLLRMMVVEMVGEEKEAGYFGLISEKSFINSKESWRIPYALGNLYFRRNNFDKAIIYLNKAKNFKPTHSVILDLLIQSYSRLKLPTEAVGLIKQQVIGNNLTLRKILKYSDVLYENSEFISLLDSEEENEKSNLMFSFAKVKSLILKNRFIDAENCLEKIEKKISFDTDNLLVIAQYYFDCRSPASARRVMEKYLSQKEELSQNNIIESASIYYQLNDHEKALHLIDVSKKRAAFLSFIKADILLQQKENALAGEAFNDAIHQIENNKETAAIKFENFDILIPENWKKDISDQYILAILLKIQDGQLMDAFDFAMHSIDQFSTNQSLKELTFKLAYLLGNKTYVDEYIKKNLVDHDNFDKEGILILAGDALENNEEVKAAKIIAEFNNGDNVNNHLAVIQARLLNRNGSQPEAQDIYITILEQMQLESLPREISSIKDINKILYYLGVCGAAFELEDLSTAIDICRKLIYSFGITTRIAKIFLKILTTMLERNRLNDELLIKNHNFRIIEDDLEIFEEIRKNEKLKCVSLKEWIDRSMAVLYNENTCHEEVIKLSPNEENVGAIIFSLISLGRITEADNILALMANNQEGLFNYAVLYKDIEPEKAKSVILEILRKGDPKPEHYMALSITNEHLGKLSDSYSALCLALDKWPEEYEWENIAGNLSKKLGNNRAAYGHFQNAEIYNPKIKYTNQIVRITTESVRLTKIKDLREQLTNTKKDLPILMKIADALVEEDKLDEAVYFIEKARIIQPDKNEIKIIYGKIAYKKGNFRESQEITNSILNHSPNNTEAIILKSMIIKELENADSAISFLVGLTKINEVDHKEILVIQTAKYISQETGVDIAIKYLLDQKELLGDTNILIYLAKLYKINGDATNTLQYAEKALSNDSENVDVLFLLCETAKDLGDLDKAIDYLFKVIAIDPFDGKKYIAISQLFENRRDYKRTIDILMEGLDILPDDYDLLRYTGILLYKQGRYKEANTILERALEIDNEDSDLHNIKRILDNSTQIKMSQNSKKEE